MRLNINLIVAKLYRFIKENPLFLIILVVSLGIRLYNFEPHLTFLGDQGRDAIIIKRIVTLEHLPLVGPPTSIGQVFLGPFYYYLVAPFLWLWNFSPVGLGYGVLILSILGTIVGTMIVGKYLGKWVALIFLYLISFSAVNIAFSRFSWNPNLLPIFSFFTLYYFYQFLTLQRFRDAFLFGMFFALSLQLHYVTAALVLPFIVLVILFHKSVTKDIRRFILALGTSIASFTFFFSPLIIFDLRHDFVNFQTFLKMFTSTDVVSSKNMSLLSRFMDTQGQFINHALQISFTQAQSLALLGVVFLIGVYYFKKSKNNFFLVYFVSFFGFLIGFSFLNSQRYEHYYGPAYISFYVVIASILIGQFRKKSKNIIATVLTAGILIVYTVTNYAGFNNIFAEGSRRVEYAQHIAQTITDHISGSPFQMVALPYTESDAPMRYFVERNGYVPLSESTISNPKELFVLCFPKKCDVLNNAQWQIAAFQDKKIATMWTVEDITVYKLIHKK